MSTTSIALWTISLSLWGVLALSYIVLYAVLGYIRVHAEVWTPWRLRRWARRNGVPKHRVDALIAEYLRDVRADRAARKARVAAR